MVPDPVGELRCDAEILLQRLSGSPQQPFQKKKRKSILCNGYPAFLGPVEGRRGQLRQNLRGEMSPAADQRLPDPAGRGRCLPVHPPVVVGGSFPRDCKDPDTAFVPVQCFQIFDAQQIVGRGQKRRGKGRVILLKRLCPCLRIGFSLAQSFLQIRPVVRRFFAQNLCRFLERLQVIALAPEAQIRDDAGL